MNRARASFLLLILLLVCAGGCSRKSQEIDDTLQVTVETDPSPPKVGTGALTVVVIDADGKPVTDAKVRVEGTMAHAGMASVYADLMPAGAPGRYSGRLEWTMGGDWILIVSVERSDGRRLERRLPVNGVRSG